MTYESDAADAQLLEDGDIAALLAKYDDAIVGRCVAKLRGHADAEDVAQDVRMRLFAECQRGKRYGDTPYRVVVHQVIGWTIADYFEGRPTHVPLPAGWEPTGDDETGTVVSRYYLSDLFAPLPDKTRQVLERRYLLGEEAPQIAAELGMTLNAVHQRLFQGHQLLRTALADG